MSLCSATSAPLAGRLLRLVVALAALLLSLPPVPGLAHPEPIVAPQAAGLVVSEVMTGGVSASDEFIELYNPTAMEIGLQGLELVYVTASGTTMTRRVAWDAGAPSIDPARHLLVANAAGMHAAIADATFDGGMAATGGSVALRQQGAPVAIDAVGWGTAASPWLEGLPAPAPAAGESLERLPGRTLGSGQDSDDNLADFVTRPFPDPQSLQSPPISQPPPAPMPSGSPTPTPTPVPGPPTVTVADARAFADGSVVTIAATALTAASFSEGGGYVADDSGGIAVLVESGSFERGQRLVLTGEVDDRFHQRTLRVDGDLEVVGTGVAPPPIVARTGGVTEPLEGRLVAVVGRIVGAPTALSGGLAFPIDDGSGQARVLVGSGTGIATDAWVTGATISVVGVVGQRDSSGGSGGYRVQPRDVHDVIAVGAPTLPPPPASASPPSTPAGGGLLSIAQARRHASGAAVRVRGVVTLPDDLVEQGSAALQDASGAILLRLGDDVGSLRRGELVEVVGTRSTYAGMLTIRLTQPPARLGRSPEPLATSLASGGASDAHEARLVVVRGALVASARRASSGTVSFDIDDGSGPLRVSLAAATGAESAARDLAAGTWVEVRGVLGQQTTGARPSAGYRLWPRDRHDLTIIAAAAGHGADAAGTVGATDATSAGKSSALSLIDDSLATVLDPASGGGPRRIEATLVAGAWPQLGVAAVLWDGRHAAAIVDDPHARAALGALLADGPPPFVVRLTVGGASEPAASGVPSLHLAAGERVERAATRPARPASEPPVSGPPRWVRLTGRFSRDGAAGLLTRPSGALRVELACDASRATALTAGETVALQGLATAVPPRLFVGCDGLRRAPMLALAAEHDAAWVTPTPDPISPADEPPPDHRPVAVIGLAMLATLVVAAAGLLLRARHASPATEPEPERSPAAASRDPLGDSADGDPPQLTLVQLPRERGSP